MIVFKLQFGMVPEIKVPVIHRLPLHSFQSREQRYESYLVVSALQNLFQPPHENVRDVSSQIRSHLIILVPNSRNASRIDFDHLQIWCLSALFVLVAACLKNLAIRLYPSSYRSHVSKLGIR